MYIGEVAKITGLSIKAIRLYEEKGLIMPPPRKGKYRVYNESHLDILNLIKEAKLLGVTLSQLKSAIVYKNGDVDWSGVGKFLLELKQQLLLKVDDLNIKVKRVETCLLTIDFCPLHVDSPPKGRD
ncbi:transcriptional regulator [Marinomonas primoryensis]|jgi:DNA-binding transcriptional MerR regulator|uniref:HTH-type transcriptional regulator CueR n=2 Tax=Marinomonas TaxID=28253 RepID=A0A2Z4PWK1_9GAMM|nr:MULTISPECIES: MerR family transcriptional regulator [Marinomonas]AWY01992.1 transcriptional regulator [Marinomonas primoryensis]MDE8604102.1 MerR family transcriptional regulator [Marinomonas maritima]